MLRVQLPLVDRPGQAGLGLARAGSRCRPTSPPTHGSARRRCGCAGHRVRVDLPFGAAVPATSATGHRVAVGYDWGLNTLLTGVVGHLAGGRVLSDGRMLRYDATAISAKLHRLRGHREHLAAKRDHYPALAAASAPRDRRPGRAPARARMPAPTPSTRTCAPASATSTTRWPGRPPAGPSTRPTPSHATVIYLEDLATLAGAGTRKGNARLSGQVRGTVVDAIHHLAAKAGIAVVTVPARGTSKYCPRCGNGTDR